jgi:hypothetical protein
MTNKENTYQLIIKLLISLLISCFTYLILSLISKLLPLEDSIINNLFIILFSTLFLFSSYKNIIFLYKNNKIIVIVGIIVIPSILINKNEIDITKLLETKKTHSGKYSSENVDQGLNMKLTIDEENGTWSGEQIYKSGLQKLGKDENNLYQELIGVEYDKENIDNVNGFIKNGYLYSSNGVTIVGKISENGIEVGQVDINGNINGGLLKKEK